MNNNYLVTEKTSKLLLKFSIPCVMSMLINALYNIVDQIFIGNSSVGTIGNTATTISFPLTCIALAFALLLGDGCAAYMSLCMGRKENDKLAKAVGGTITVALLLGATYMALSLCFLPKIMVVLGAKTELSLQKSLEYGYIIVYGFPFFVAGAMLNGIIRADGRPQLSMVSMIAGAVTNIVLDATFIFGLNWGLKGAATATIIGQFLSFVISLCFILKARNFKLTWKNMIPGREVFTKVAKLGVSSLLTQLSIVIISVVSMNMLAKFGAQSKYGADDPQAIVGVTMKVFTIFIGIAVGVAVGAQPIVGYNYGAGRIDRVKQVYKQMLLVISVVGVVATILFQTLPRQIISIFGSNSKNIDLYLEFGEMTIRIYLSCILFTLLQKVSAIFLQALGKPVQAAILSMFRDVVMFVPLIIAIPHIMNSIVGILWAAPIADTCGIILTAIVVWRELKKMDKAYLPNTETEVE